jgi:hypothetical protein
VKVTEAPGQIGFALAAMDILTGRTGLTNIVTGFDIAGFPDGQVVFDVSLQVITSPFTGV